MSQLVSYSDSDSSDETSRDDVIDNTSISMAAGDRDETGRDKKDEAETSSHKSTMAAVRSAKENRGIERNDEELAVKTSDEEERNSSNNGDALSLPSSKRRRVALEKEKERESLPLPSALLDMFKEGVCAWIQVM